MEEYMQHVRAATDFLKTQTPVIPRIGVITGTGLGEAARLIEVTESFNYRDIPHFMTPTVESHVGRMLFGVLANQQIVIMQGRSHLYEGCSPLDVTFPIRVLKSLGVKVLIISNASGGLNPEFSPGDIMAVSDHINLTGLNPLVGPNVASWGPRFPDMSRVYDAGLLELVKKAGADAHVAMQNGVYVGLAGPSLETPAEARFLRTIGADAVGFSTVLESIAAVHSGMRIAGLSVITNIHNPDDPKPAKTDEIISKARETVPLLEQVIKRMLLEIDEHECD